MKPEIWMKRAIQIAQFADKEVKTNPNVGCVIVHNERIIGEGYHQVFGGAHAEVNAFDNVRESEWHLIKEASVYITLEPCSIHMKTPPCTDLILKHRPAHVYIGTVDPNPAINGRGIELLKREGIKVHYPLLEEECKKLIRPFNNFQKGMPYIILKWAQTSNGFMGLTDKRLWVSGSQVSVLTHSLRAQSDGILIGTNTALIDNPHLTTRVVEGDNPTRLVFDLGHKLPSNLHIFNDKSQYLRITDHDLLSNDIYFNPEGGLKPLLKALFDRGLYRILVEGGATTLQAFIHEILWDEAYIITSRHALCDTKVGVKAPRIQGRFTHHTFEVGPDHVTRLYNNLL